MTFVEPEYLPQILVRTRGPQAGRQKKKDFIASSKYSVGPYIRPICTGCSVIMANMTQQCSNFHCICSPRLSRLVRRRGARRRRTLSVGPSIPPICTRCCLTMTNIIQVCSNFQRDRAFIINTVPDAIAVVAVERIWHI